MKLTGTIIAFNSKRDSSGNVYWAMRYIDHETGKVVNAMIGGGESNIRGILQHWNPNLPKYDWDRSIIFHTKEMPKKEFKTMVADWPYGGCASEDIAKFIREQLNDIAMPIPTN